MSDKMIFPNRSWFTADSLEVLKKMPDESVHLIAAEPPGMADFQRLSGDADTAEAARSAINEEVPRAWQLIEIWGSVSEPCGVSAHDGVGLARYLAYLAERLIEIQRVLTETGALYWHCEPESAGAMRVLLDCVFGLHCWRNDIIWCKEPLSDNAPGSHYPRWHDTIFFYGKSPDTVACDPPVTAAGAPAGSWWNDCGPGVAVDRDDSQRERPLSLYRRMVLASSQEGDLVLDPFAGSGTVCVAAEAAGRRWIGIDIDPDLRQVATDRLASECSAPVVFQNWPPG